ncbi:MAG: hypothetical protein DRQ51_05790 [Gammaproteobacteria bacterium]|nr:MAG: hypothetical protein DRQ51_05790 [Gammaproteobacteria bacterium]
MSIIKKFFDRTADIVDGNSNLSVSDIKIELAKQKASEMFYEQAMNEIAKDNKKPGIWAQAMTKTNFDEDKARSVYMQLRVESLQNTAVEQAIQNQETNRQKQIKIQQKLELQQKLGKFEIIDENVALDNNTGLMWKRHHETKKMSWQEALDYAKNHNFAAFDDWRLPSIDELKTIVEKDKKPAINHYAFIGASAISYFWSSTPHSFDSNYAWRMNFYNGYDYYDDCTDTGYVRLVRGGK